MKERIRENLKLLEDNMSHFNDFSLKWIDKKALRKLISIWRWYVSHGYFNEKHPKPKGICSNPPMSYLDSHLNGQTTPLGKDIGLCIAPVIASTMMTEHAARRIMNRLNMIYAYVSPDDALRDQQEHREREEKKQKDRLRAAKAREDRKAKKKLEIEEFIEKNQERLDKEWKKKKTKERKELHERKERESKTVREKAIKMIQDANKEMRERRKRGY